LVDILSLCILLAHCIICAWEVAEVHDVGVEVVEESAFVGVAAIIQARAIRLFSRGHVKEEEALI